MYGYQNKMYRYQYRTYGYPNKTKVSCLADVNDLKIIKFLFEFPASKYLIRSLP